MNAKRILICEDEGIVALDFKKRLEGFGYFVTGIAASGKRANELVAETKPDLILMDIHLEGDVLGTEVAEVLSREYGVPSIFLTAYSDSETLDAAKHSMPLGFLVKPVNDNELRAAIEIGMSFFDQQKLRERTARKRLEKLQVAFEAKSQDLDWYEGQHDLNDSEKERVLTNISAGVAHHLNNSLTTIMCSLDWLEQCGTIESFEMRFLKTAQEGCKSAERVVNDLFLASGHGIYMRQFCDLQEMIDIVVDRVREKIGGKCHIVKNYPLRLERVLAPEDILTNVLEAVVTNACEFAFESDEISITVSREECLNPHEKNENAKPGWFGVVEIRDSGPGMEQAVLEHSTEPFFSTHNDSVRKGMGLSVAKGVAASLGGWLIVDSEKDIGTTVKIFLPLCEFTDARSTSLKKTDELLHS